MSDMHHHSDTPSSLGSPSEHHQYPTSHHHQHQSQDAGAINDGDSSSTDGSFPAYGVDQRHGHSRQPTRGPAAKSLQIVFLVIFVVVFLTVLTFIITGAHTVLRDSGYGLAPTGAGTFMSLATPA